MIRMLNNQLAKLGFRIIRVSSLSPEILNSEIFEDAYQIAYVNKGNGVIVNVPINKGRALPIFDYSEASNHPYVLAARRALLKGTERELLIREVLKTFFDLFNPKNPNEILGLQSDRTELKEFPYWSVLMPWDSEDPNEWIVKIEKSVRVENKLNKRNLGIDSGWAWAGPASSEKCEIETKRLLRVLNSIELRGYLRNNRPDGDIAVNLLARSNSEWVWQSIVGQHRAAVLSALGHQNIQVSVRNIVRREDVSSWPNVIRGIYSQNEALKVFDKIYHANYSYISSSWNTYAAGIKI